jgi:hypothetical protein
VDTRGPIPFDRHEQAIRNAREQAAADAIKQYAWARGYSQQDVEAAIGLASRLNGDANGFYQQLGRELGVQQPQQPQQQYAQPVPPRTIESIFPAADLVSEDGKKAYSEGAVQQAFQNFASYMTEEMDKRYAPVLETVQQVQTERSQYVRDQHYGGIAKDALTEAQALPSWKELQPEIATELKRIGQSRPDVITRQGAVGTMMMIYNRLFAQKVLPTLDRNSQSAVLADLQRKANAERGSASAAASGSSAVRQAPKNVRELAEHMEHIAASLG